MTSPLESPFDDFLSTPGLRNDEFVPDFISPLIADGDDFGADFHDTPLFDDVGLFEPPSSDKHAALPLFTPTSIDNMERLIGRAFASHELPSLIETIFSDEDKGDTVNCLHGDDVQTFIDVVDEVRTFCTCLSSRGPVDRN